MRQRVGVRRHGGVEARQAHAVYQNVRQQGVAAQGAGVDYRIGVRCAVLGSDEYLLERVAHIRLQDRLSLAGRDCQHRQRRTLVYRQAVVEGLRHKSKGIALYLHIRQRGVAVLLDGITDGITLFGAVLG